MLAVVIGRAAPLRVGNNAVAIRVPSHVVLLRNGVTASGGVTFMRVFSSLIPSTCFIAYLLFAWTNFHVSFAILLLLIYARK